MHFPRALRNAEMRDNARQLDASLRLTAWLRCRYGIPVKDAIGHTESLSSPYHHELIPSLRNQTYSDCQHKDMVRDRRILAQRPCRP